MVIYKYNNKKGGGIMNEFMQIIWIAAMIAALILEAASFTLISVWFALGALAAVIASLLGAPVWIQTAVFLAVSICSLAVTRPVLKKMMPQKYIPTNGELDIGRNAVVIERIDPATGTGRVRIGGIDWGARTEDGSSVDEGEVVTVTAKGAAFVTVSQNRPITFKKES